MSASILLWPFFWLILILTLWYVFAELYHWLRFGWMYPWVWIAMPVYLVGVFVFIGAMLAAIGAA
jgi:hypothetical protein